MEKKMIASNCLEHNRLKHYYVQKLKYCEGFRLLTFEYTVPFSLRVKLKGFRLWSEQTNVSYRPEYFISLHSSYYII